jgi:uncharacterized protein YecE (DUF72 family)
VVRPRPRALASGREVRRGRRGGTRAPAPENGQPCREGVGKAPQKARAPDQADAARLAGFLDALPSGWRYAFEFRDESWFSSDVFETLSRHNAAFCAYELSGRRSPIEPTANFIYVRLHGPGGPYQGNYDGRTLYGWVRRFLDWRKSGKDVYCFFDNDQDGYAALNALATQDMISRH